MRRSDCGRELNRPAIHFDGRRWRLASRSRILTPSLEDLTATYSRGLKSHLHGQFFISANDVISEAADEQCESDN
jgi:hypothetical protein